MTTTTTKLSVEIHLSDGTSKRIVYQNPAAMRRLLTECRLLTTKPGAQSTLDALIRAMCERCACALPEPHLYRLCAQCLDNGRGS